MSGVRVRTGEEARIPLNTISIQRGKSRAYGWYGIAEAHSIYVKPSTNELDGFWCLDIKIDYGSLWRGTRIFDRIGDVKRRQSLNQ